MRILSLPLCLMLSSVGAGICFAAGQKTQPKRKKIILLLGPPGSGKGTQAITLAKDLKLPHISTGDLFRENMRNNTSLGQKAKVFIEAGKLVPDEIVLEMLFERIKTNDCKDGFLLDGFPRTIPQAEALSKCFNNKVKLIVINLTVSDEVIIKRAEGRLTCRVCGQVYNKFFSPPKQEGKCDLCHGELYQRTDDSPNVVQERLRVYHDQSKPLVDYYKAGGNLITINGEGPKDLVYSEIKKVST